MKNDDYSGTMISKFPTRHGSLYYQSLAPDVAERLHTRDVAVLYNLYSINKDSFIKNMEKLKINLLNNHSVLCVGSNQDLWLTLVAVECLVNRVDIITAMDNVNLLFGKFENEETLKVALSSFI